MRTWHSLCALLVTGLCMAAWAVVTSSNEPKRYTYSYDEGAGLELNTYGCDIRMLPSDTPSLSVDFISGCGARTARSVPPLTVCRHRPRPFPAPATPRRLRRQVVILSSVTPVTTAADSSVLHLARSLPEPGRLRAHPVRQLLAPVPGHNWSLTPGGRRVV
mmetsp:Transcript_32452/g.103487  ORF Transcript_32452/g.103487 Transcript_32452/m.103487 type:complete len:161 (-) Transcript_32452:134-616(-)